MFRKAFAALLVLVAFAAWTSACRAELSFPPLTGRVVDAANLIPADVEAVLDQKLAALEAKSSDQLVVVTLPSLQGTDIADYGYQLGRAWGIGQGKLNNGVLLIVAPNDRKVRLEVGYGLEGTLTDALSSYILQGAVLPAFRAGDMPKGIVAGVDAVTEVLTSNESEWKKRAEEGQRAAPDEFNGLLALIVFCLIAFVVISVIVNARNQLGGSSSVIQRRGRGPIFIPMGTSWGGSGGGGFSSGGGFSGGGGSFGGGGSSGSW